MSVNTNTNNCAVASHLSEWWKIVWVMKWKAKQIYVKPWKYYANINEWSMKYASVIFIYFSLKYEDQRS